MNLNQRLARDVAVIMAKASGPAEAMTYINGAGVETPFDGVIERLRVGEAFFDNGEGNTESAIIHVPVAKVGVVETNDRIKCLRAGATSDDDLEVWAVSGIRNENSAIREVEVVKHTRTRLVDEGNVRNITRGATFARLT